MSGVGLTSLENFPSNPHLNCLDLSDNGVPATVTQAVINGIAAGTAVTLADGSTCSGGTCNDVRSQCIRNAADSQRYFYHVLAPR